MVAAAVLEVGWRGTVRRQSPQIFVGAATFNRCRTRMRLATGPMEAEALRRLAIVAAARSGHGQLSRMAERRVLVQPLVDCDTVYAFAEAIRGQLAERPLPC
mmetsp:Transcript_55433/g.154454  ORF Transcript_55433/g.154454 Transcript_55433/m.154454 type:complete len:102 (+) Transcript_55433:837-1142(+)